MTELGPTSLSPKYYLIIFFPLYLLFDCECVLLTRYTILDLLARSTLLWNYLVVAIGPTYQ